MRSSIQTPVLIMLRMNRRGLISPLGVASVSSLTRGTTLLAQGERQPSTMAIVPPGGNRYKYREALTAKVAPCKVTSLDSGGVVSAFENVTPPKQGPPLHRHHREDEWFYVATGTFVFEIDGKRTEFGQGGSIFAPRELPHRWANTGDEPAILLVTLFPGGFETFFDEMSEALVKGHVS